MRFAIRFDVLLPVAVVLPLLTHAIVSPDTAEPGTVPRVAWLGIGGPVYCGVLSAFMFAIAGATRNGRPADGVSARLPGSLYLRWIGAASATGLVFVLLAANDHLMPFVGQCALPIVAVIMWMNAPDAPRREDATGPRRGEPDGLNADDAARASASGGPVLILAAVQLGAAIMAGYEWRTYTGAIALMWAVSAVGVIHRRHGSASGFRVGTWAAVYGPLLALTAMAITAASEQILGLWRGEPVAPISRIATGFGRYGIEAIVLLMLPIVAHGLLTLSPRSRVTLAAAALGIATAGAAYRLMMPG
jgi:hypothetical protein